MDCRDRSPVRWFGRKLHGGQVEVVIPCHCGCVGTPGDGCGCEEPCIGGCSARRVEVATTKELCPACGGEGSVVDPAIDRHGLTHEDFDDDPDFADGYFSGRYDITCPVCEGEKIVRAPADGAPAEVMALYEGVCDSTDLTDAECDMERRMGA